MGIEERKEREKMMRRRAILDAAKKVFVAKGFAGATMENIAEEAEFSPATIYLYFKNKDDYTRLSASKCWIFLLKR
jgi:AcrR family transcriptional regulator